jgi:hypothetical protein
LALAGCETCQTAECWEQSRAAVGSIHLGAPEGTVQPIYQPQPLPVQTVWVMNQPAPQPLLYPY